MVSWRGFAAKSYWTLASLGALYAVLICALTNPYLQRGALYAHRANTGRWHDVDIPENFGFAKNQVTPFNITTPDGEVLYAWHVLPLIKYAKNFDLLSDIDSTTTSKDFVKSVAYELLVTDPDAKVVINFHGNAGNVAQGWRKDTYRALTSLDPHIHVVTVDYRGFGKSTGFPTEGGLNLDGYAVASYVLDVLRIPPERIVLLGQSLGTAVASAVALSFADPTNSTGLIPAAENKTDLVARSPILFKGIVLVAAFTELPELLKTYRMAGLVPLFSPLNRYPRIQKYLMNHVVDTWPSAQRLAALVRLAWDKQLSEDTKKDIPLRLELLHAYNDFDIPYTHSEEMFFAAVNGTESAGISREKFEARRLDGQNAMKKEIERVSGTVHPRTEAWISESGDQIRLELVGAGGHNRLVTFTPVMLAILRTFDLA